MANVYAGENSTAKITVDGKVDTAYDVLKIAYALAYDVKNNTLLDRHGKVKKLNKQTVNGRFRILYVLASRTTKTGKLVEIIKELHKLALMMVDKKIPEQIYVSKIRSIVAPFLSFFDLVEIEKKVEEIEEKITGRKRNIFLLSQFKLF